MTANWSLSALEAFVSAITAVTHTVLHHGRWDVAVVDTADFPHGQTTGINTFPPQKPDVKLSHTHRLMDLSLELEAGHSATPLSQKKPGTAGFGDKWAQAEVPGSSEPSGQSQKSSLTAEQGMEAPVSNPPHLNWTLGESYTGHVASSTF